MEYKDYYTVLGVPRTADLGKIKTAFRKLARKYHPDINTSAGAEATFKDVNQAYEVLKDPERRAAYDQLADAGPTGQGPYQTPPDWDGGFSFSEGRAQNDEAYSAFFENLFRGGGSAAGRRENRATDSHARLDIGIEEAFHGTERALHIRIPVVGPDGSVTLQDRQIAVRVPKGIVAGQHIRLAGQGGEGRETAGDLFLEVNFAPHPIYRAEGKDLFLDLPIAPWEAALGGRVVMPTPGGKVDLRIPKNARSGQKMRLKGKGIPASPPGDIFATLKIVNPKADSAQARTLFEKMARDLAFDPRQNLGG